MESRLISNNRFLIPLIEVSAFKSLEGISCLIRSIVPPPCCILSSLYGGINWLEENKAPNFVSGINKTSMLFPIISWNISNLFLKEFKLICENINLVRFLSLISCKSLKLLLSFHYLQLPDKIVCYFERNHDQKLSYGNYWWPVMAS